MLSLFLRANKLITDANAFLSNILVTVSKKNNLINHFKLIIDYFSAMN